MADRLGPKDGYDHGVKRQYRREVWARLSRLCPVPRAEAKVFMMPSIEGDEIEVAIRNGFRETNINICDMSPAIVATVKRRFPRVTAHGVTAQRAMNERFHTNRLDVINLDLCGTLKTAVPTTICAARALRPGGAMAITYLRGRDGEFVNGIGRMTDRASFLVEMASSAHFSGVALPNGRVGSKRFQESLLLPEEHLCGVHWEPHILSLAGSGRYRLARSPMEFIVLKSVRGMPRKRSGRPYCGDETEEEGLVSSYHFRMLEHCMLGLVDKVGFRDPGKITLSELRSMVGGAEVV